MFKKVYSLYSAFCTQAVFYSQSAVCILHSVCILPLVRSLQSVVRTLRFTLTGTITLSKHPQHDPSCALAVQSEPGACSVSKTPRVYRP